MSIYVFSFLKLLLMTFTAFCNKIKEHCGVIRMVKFTVMGIVTLFQSKPFTTEYRQNRKKLVINVLYIEGAISREKWTALSKHPSSSVVGELVCE